MCFLSWQKQEEFQRQTKKVRIMPLAIGVWFRTITEEKTLFYCISKSYQGVPRLNRVDVSFHGAHVWLKKSIIFLTVKILNSNVHLMIEEGTISDPHKSLHPFLIAAAQTQSRNLTFLNLLKDYPRNFQNQSLL